MTWTLDNSGTQTATIGTEHTLDSPSTSATYVFMVDTVNMANNDILELRCYDKVDATNLRVIWKGTYQHIQVVIGKASPPLAVTAGAQFTLKQTAGTGRSYPWSVRRI
jgi:hypothetical protein